MDYAAWPPREDPYQADEIWIIRGADKIDWRCPECNYILRPVAWRGDKKYEVRAHFRAPDGHGKECLADGFEQIFENVGTQKIQDVQGITHLVPSVVTFPGPRDVLSTPPGGDLRASALTKMRYVYPAKESRSPINGTHRRWAKTLYRVTLVHATTSVRTRMALPLEVEGCDGTTYYDVFVRDVAPEDNAPVLSRRIFFANVKFNQKPDYTGESGPEIELLAGRRSPKSKQKDPAYRVKIAWQHWPKELRLLLLGKLEEKRLQLREDYWNAVKSSLDIPSATLYFIGNQDAQDPFLFHVADRHQIELVYLGLSERQKRTDKMWSNGYGGR